MYEILEEMLVTDDNIKYISYGVRYRETGLSISDVTMNKQKMLDFIRLINFEELQPVHLPDAVEDFIDNLI